MRILATCLALSATPLAADELRVVSSIPPLHSLTAQVMGDIATPELLIQPTASPHGYALRPSEARRLAEADVIIWLGAEASPWLAEASEQMAPNATSLALMDLDGVTLLKARGAHHHHDHDHDHDHEGEGHDDHEDHSDHDDHKAEEDHDHDHEGHDHDEEHAADHKDEKAHEDEHDHDHDHEGHDHEGHDDKAHKDDDHNDHAHMDETGERTDSHTWLDPENAALWLTAIADELAKQDPDNAAAYKANAEKAIADLTAQTATIAERLKSFEGKAFLTAHDAFQYFEARFGLKSRAALSDTEGANAGPAHLRDVLEEEGELACFVNEPSTPAATTKLVTDTLGIKAVILDPTGGSLEQGAGQYAALLESLATGFEDCFSKE